MKNIFFAIVMIMASADGLAQGPPITADKPIMLGGNTIVIRTLTEFRNTVGGNFVKAPLIVNWLPSSDLLFSAQLPLTTYNFLDSDDNDGSYLGDIALITKYQFYRKDGQARTHRVVLKSNQKFPTGQEFGPFEIANGTYQHYLSIVSGYETIKYGISAEAGYNWAPGDNIDEYRLKLGFGLPLLKPTYPVNQLNLYFEYFGQYRPESDETELLYAQGIQYARGRLTVEFAVQVPLFQSEVIQRFRLNNDILIGARYIF